MGPSYFHIHMADAVLVSTVVNTPTPNPACAGSSPGPPAKRPSSPEPAGSSSKRPRLSNCVEEEAEETACEPELRDMGPCVGDAFKLENINGEERLVLQRSAFPLRLGIKVKDKPDPIPAPVSNEVQKIIDAVHDLPDVDVKRIWGACGSIVRNRVTPRCTACNKQLQGRFKAIGLCLICDKQATNAKKYQEKTSATAGAK